MPKFVHKESIAHEAAKHKLAEWLSICANGRNTAYIEYPILNECNGYLIDDCINFGLFNKSLQEMFPTCYNEHTCVHYDHKIISRYSSISNIHLPFLKSVKQIEGSFNWCPSYELCVYNNLYPVAIVDIVIPHKGCILELWEIKRTHAIDDKKLHKIANALVFDNGLLCNRLYEISADWVLSQDVNINKYDAIKRAKEHATVYKLGEYLDD